MKRLTLFAGHYGSGKTNVAINYAMYLKKQGLDVVIADLDIVNPYFRTKDSLEELNAAGIDLISSEYAGSNVDFPALPQSMYALTQDKSRYGVLDIGGDDRGAYALGRYSEDIIAENNYDMLLVINKYRPLTKTPDLCIEVMHEIEDACGMKFTGIVNNSNLGEDTSPEDVLNSVPYAEEVAQRTSLPIVFTTVSEKVYNKCVGRICNVYPVKLQKKVFEEA